MKNSEIFFEENQEKTNNDNEDELTGNFPCPLCNLGLEIRLSKNKKPYCVCNTCGLQLFIRGKKGINKLKEFLKSNLTEKTDNKDNLSPEIDNNLGINKSKKAIVILNEIQLLENKRKEIEENLTFWESIFGNEEKEKVLNILNDDLEKLKNELKNI